MHDGKSGSDEKCPSNAELAAYIIHSCIHTYFLRGSTAPNKAAKPDPDVCYILGAPLVCFEVPQYRRL